ncbi:hypothetical protein ACTG9Q_23620 [Actinokineospora sp. 24-640]
MLRTNVPPRPLWCGLEYGPALVVLDQADARPRDLPPAWAPLALSFQIAWCATPGPDSGPEAVEDVLETLADRRVHTAMVVDAALAQFAVTALREFSHIVRSLIVVGPGEVPDTTVRTRRVPGSGVSSPAVVKAVHAELDPRARLAPLRVDGWART